MTWLKWYQGSRISFGGRCSCGMASMPANAMPASVCFLAMSKSSCHSCGVGVAGSLSSLPIPHLIRAKNSSVTGVLSVWTGFGIVACRFLYIYQLSHFLRGSARRARGMNRCFFSLFVVSAKIQIYFLFPFFSYRIIKFYHLTHKRNSQSSFCSIMREEVGLRRCVFVVLDCFAIKTNETGFCLTEFRIL